MATSLDISKKEVQIDHLHPKSFHSTKIAKICPADPEIICFREIIKKEKKEITEVKYIALPASLPRGLNKLRQYHHTIIRTRSTWCEVLLNLKAKPKVRLHIKMRQSNF